MRKREGDQPRADRKGYARSRLTNGKDLLPNIDGRSLIARRYRDIYSAIAADPGRARSLVRSTASAHSPLCCLLRPGRRDGKPAGAGRANRHHRVRAAYLDNGSGRSTDWSRSRPT
jgi:hypothetical protein